MTRLVRCETSYGAAHGECAVWLSDDTLCSKTLGHDGSHRGYDPSGSGNWIDYNAEGEEVARKARPLPSRREGEGMKRAPEDLERGAITAAVVGRTITSVVTEQRDSWDDDLKAVHLTLDDGSVVSLVSRMSLDEGWLGITSTPPG